MGPVCRPCYGLVRNNPAECAQCCQRRPLIGRRDDSTPICGPCAGLEVTYTCRSCGELYHDQQCARCVLTTRVDALPARPDATIPAHIEPVRRALIGTDNPQSMLFWLQRSPGPVLLADLAAADEPTTHQSLDTRPATPASHYVRELLITAGILPVRNEYVDAIPAWADTLLASTPAHHRQLLSPFVHWLLLHRARRRGSHSRSSADHLRSRLRRAMELLAWIDEHHPTIDTLIQGDFEQWLSAGATTRHHIDAFVNWANARSLLADISVPRRRSREPARALDDADRRDQLRRCLTDTTLLLPVRVGGALILPFGLQGTRIAHLTRADLHNDGNHVTLAIENHQLELPPKLADMIRDLRDQPTSYWRLNRPAGRPTCLLPGRYPSRPMARTNFGGMLAEHSITIRDARNSVHYALASQLPASVLADLTGTSIGNAVEWTNWAKRNWHDYVATRAQDKGNTAPIK
ncbi:hypothetical protein [Nocardia sp. NPDC059239]|uniref:hypothetical protein n=1 Tax=Nocardia sp. NPDC059239 TaxID=3346785 RepID=UPI0036C188C5